MSERVASMARRVSHDPYFLASVFSAYARSERLDERGLAAALGCTVEALVPLRLCRRPLAETPIFRDDVARIAARYEVNPVALAQIIRRVDALEALRRGVNDAGMLVAARDRDDHDPPDDANGNQS